MIVRAVVATPAAMMVLTAGCSSTATDAVMPDLRSQAAKSTAAYRDVGDLAAVIQVWPTDAEQSLDHRRAEPATSVGSDITGATETSTPARHVPGSAGEVEATELDRILQQVGVAEQAYDAAVRRPEDTELLAALEMTTVEDSPARLEFVGAYSAMVEAGRWSKPDAEVPNSVAVLPEGYPILADDGHSAWVLVCAVSGDSLMGLDEAGGPVVLADARNAREVWQEFRLVDGVWLLFQRVQVEIYPEATSCDNEVSVSSSVPAS